LGGRSDDELILLPLKNRIVESRGERELEKVNGHLRNLWFLTASSEAYFPTGGTAVGKRSERYR